MTELAIRALVALGRAHRLIANDWQQHAVVALDDELAVRRWLTDN